MNYQFIATDLFQVYIYIHTYIIYMQHVPIHQLVTDWLSVHESSILSAEQLQKALQTVFPTYVIQLCLCASIIFDILDQLTLLKKH